MLLLSASHYELLHDVLNEIPFNTLFAQAVINQKVDGVIYVDNVDSPSVFYIVHPYGMSLLVGDTENEAFNQSLRSYLTDDGRATVEYLQVYPEVWRDKLPDILGEQLLVKESPEEDVEAQDEQAGAVVENVRVNFQLNRERYDEIRNSLAIDEQVFVQTEADIFEEAASSVTPKYFWRDAAQFIEQGIGFSLILDDKVVATAFSSFIEGEQLELGIETHAQYRGRGCASLVCARLIDHCLENGLEPVWACRLANQGSYRLALKLGFEPIFHLPYYRLNSGMQNQVTLALLEERIGYVFTDKQLLRRALTRASFLAQRDGGEGTKDDFEALEFVGDRALNLCIATALFENDDHARPRELSEAYTNFTRNNDDAKRNGGPLYRVAKTIDLEVFLMKLPEENLEAHGKRGKKPPHRKTKESHLADHVEALIGAIFMDSGKNLQEVEAFVRIYWGPLGLNNDDLVSESSYGASELTSNPLQADVIQSKRNRLFLDRSRIYQWEQAQQLLELEEFPAIPTAVDFRGRSAVHYFAERGNIRAVQMLIDEYFVPVDFSVEQSGATPLFYAAMGGRKDLVDMLVSKEADITKRVLWQGRQHTAFSIAAAFGHSSLLTYMLGAFADCFSLEDVEYAIEVATSGGRANVVSQLKRVYLEGRQQAEFHYLCCAADCFWAVDKGVVPESSGSEVKEWYVQAFLNV